MKVKNLVADGWCPGCLKAKGYTYTLAHSNDPNAVELPETCTCDGTVSALPSSAPTVVVHGHVSEEVLRAMVRGMVADALADVKNVKEVPLD
ncbi:hypothetical protein KSF_095880 [Reticulibacter mediterranei]|uniref:Uncharacterized protein n=1 Tax=Reticulibacter mediterranei TaxID=2778369 RepID=A0A8J3IZB1_9CHLR|nr:hypothetical protein [Reticulibacter mediterranei]GHO99540.1 hypothetical protein KSF_095880 [Reticulibacter mediterranei]